MLQGKLGHPIVGVELGFELGKSGTEVNMLGYSTQLPPGREFIPFTAEAPTPSPCYSAWHIVGGWQTWADGPPKRPSLPKGLWGWEWLEPECDAMQSLSRLLLAPESQVLVPCSGGS